MKHARVLKILLAVIFFINWSELALARSGFPEVEKRTEKTVQSQTAVKCDTQKLVENSEALKKEQAVKLQSFDPNSKTVKNKIINDGVSVNIFLVKLLAAQESCKNIPEQKKWVQTEISKNIVTLKAYTNSYCKSVLIPTRSTSTAKSSPEDVGTKEENGDCDSNAERRMVNFVFNACTPGSADYDIKLCECHVKSRDNSCFTETVAAEKLVKKISAATDDEICDEKTPQKTDSMVDSKNLLDIGKIVLLALGTVAALYFLNKYFKNKDTKKNADALAAGGTTGGTAGAGGLPKSFKGRYSGSVDMSNHEERIIARNIALTEMGKPITGNDAVDNAATGGGTPDGGIYMAGSFEFTVDSNNTITSGVFIIHGYRLNLGGGKINSDGSFNINPEGLEVAGKLNGTSISGIANEYGKPHVFGRLNGVFTASK